MASKQRNDATQSSKGTIYQICIAVLKCYEMQRGQTVLIEREGDVSIEADQQVEIKLVSGDLTDSHISFWNTLVNWIDDGFDPSRYASLILHTTQQYGTNTKLSMWNESNVIDRLSILEDIARTSEERFETALIKKPGAPIPRSLQLMRRALMAEKRPKLEEVVSKYYIDSAMNNLPETHKLICDLYLKGIDNQSDFLNSLIGFVSHAEESEENEWEITYDEFAAKVAELIRIYKKDSYAFPRKHFDEAHLVPAEIVDQHLTYRFVRKIEEIEYHQVIHEAIRDYLGAVRTMNDDFKHHYVSKKRITDYVEDLISLFEAKHRIASRKVNPTNDDAKNFYDSFMAEESRDFSGFERPHRGFKNGIMHTQIDDDTKSLHWKLENL